ncbi:hypothetical protein CNMCM5793_002817 [Aspergillus hiratsukae]|uniref:Uncharacterized protein n=1 Tax=Aspergillus hiratsukae TaxID=1194566 RepID=A0A8H6UGV9_9EURO|nr:hypothetical protein CNMCM5793_002817 [Aspergillus hiratsukae]KAF7169576.1 hypothetical protein CNMCM6106_004466 [Aspergillus hiratsukae]
MPVQESPPHRAQSAEQPTQTTDPAMQPPENGKSEHTDTSQWIHILFDIKTSPKKLSGVLLESLHHKLHRSEVKVYSSFDILRAAGAVKRGNLVFALPNTGQNADQAIMAARTKVQHLIMDWDKREVSGEGLCLVVEDKMSPWGWDFLPYQAWKEQRKRR